jgi:hypothetical protein
LSTNIAAWQAFFRKTEKSVPKILAPFELGRVFVFICLDPLVEHLFVLVGRVLLQCLRLFSLQALGL